MSAIKLPVKVQMAIDDSRDAELVESSGWFVAKRMSEEHAKQIAFALNWHDDFVGTLREIATSKGKLTVKQVRNIAQQVLARSQQPHP